MRPAETFLSQPIRSLQTMLRVIAQEDTRQPSLVPDGIYGPQTTIAVSEFQRNHALPITGVVDQLTWETVTAEYDPAWIRVGPAQTLELILDSGEELLLGSRNPNLYVIQAVLSVLSQAYRSVTPPPFTGILDEATAESIATFQTLSGLPATGNLDKVTWKHLALQYPLATNSLKNTAK